MHHHKIIFVLFCFFGLQLGLESQDLLKNSGKYLDIDAEPKTYEIASVTIDGSGHRDKVAIKSIAGLREGDKITVPGSGFQKGLKALYRLGLFENVELIQDSISGDLIHLTIKLIESPTLSRYSFKGVKKSKHDDLNDIVKGVMNRGGIVTVNSKALATKRIKEFYIDKGYFNVGVNIEEVVDTIKTNSVRLVFDVDKKEKVKISEVSFEGHEELSNRKLKKLVKNTKKKGTFLRKSKYVKEKFEEDKVRIIEHYNKLGFRDAKILRDSLWKDDEGLLRLHLVIEEGQRYFYRNVTWKGNSIYTDEQLGTILGINRGDVFNKELLEKRLSFSLDGRDISSLYLDQGYLFFDITPVETAVYQDSIDIEMRISEGALANIDNVIINGNDRTNEHVIRRELRTKPGQKFSRSDIIRSQRQIINLGYFNPESLDIQTPLNQARGTVDVVYTVEEQPSDQLELSAGYGGVSGLIGTLGVTFNNFSVQNITNRSTWNPLPQGDGQRLSLRIQSNSRFFRSYNFSFTEPWLGGKKPNSLTIGAALSSIDNSTFGRGRLDISRLYAGIGTQMKFPDDFFVSNTILGYDVYKLQDYPLRFLVDNGTFRNFNIKQTFSRSSVNEPIYPRRGAKVSLTIQLTPPYSLFRGDDYWVLSEEEQLAAIEQENLTRGFLNQMTEVQEAVYINNLEFARRFDWLEYHKWRFDTEWYFNFTGKFVMAAFTKMGYLGQYDSSIGTSPFERFEYGGDGLSNQNNGITGTDIISARGYPDENIEFPANALGGGVIFNKFTVELRYPLSLNPSSSIYFQTFLQAGNVWSSFDEYNPFDLKRSAGVGLRVFLPMFGLLGFDYGFGFDRNLPDNSKWSEYGSFNIILGFEPE